MKRAILPVVWTLQAHLVAVPKTLTIIVALWFRLDIKESESENEKSERRNEKYQSLKINRKKFEIHIAYLAI